MTWLSALVALLLPLVAAAQTPVPITAAELARHIGVLAHDSMRGRATPSRELELAAQHVAAEFQRLGLGASKWEASDWRNDPRIRRGENPWIQRYPIPGQYSLDHAA